MVESNEGERSFYVVAKDMSEGSGGNRSKYLFGLYYFKKGSFVR